ESRGARYLPLYLRRLLVLLLFGLIHATVLWAGDILVIYAVTGLVLVLFRNASPRALRVWIAISLALPVLWVGAMTGIYNLTRLIVPGAEGLEARATQRQRLEAEMALETYNEGSFVERFAQRVSDLKLSYAGLAINGWFLNGLALFLMGLYVGKSGILQDVQAHLGAIRRARWWGLGLGLTGASMTLWGDLAANPIRPTFATLVEMAGHAVGDPALAVFYGASLVLLVQDERWQKRLAPLAAAGRLALTNYLAQSLIVTTVLTGFGLFGKVGPAAGLIMTVVIYAAQLVFSQWWTARFRFGPAEWLWRTLQYGKRQPMRLPG
ncbi:MAG TPA: DUF418 domain-containing protein, partial [Symbiobacteriaceae bacterium]|nr:DUF418 domain-containing protein [Symbiobacteriaceae bacterium]